MKKNNPYNYILLFITILLIYQYNTISDLKMNIIKLQTNYDDLETTYTDLKEDYNDIESELDEFRTCFEDQNWTYCVEKYI